MKNIYSTALSAAFIVISFSGNLSAESKNQPSAAGDSVDLIENAIIIDSLSLTSQTPPSAEAEQGDIVYDDDFMDEEKTASHTIAAKKNPAEKNSRQADIITELKKKDCRWHLSSYKIKQGDNLWSIARRFNTSHKLIVEVNGINKSSMLKPGKKIQIPNRNGFEYTVKKGDSLSAVSRRFKTDSGKIVSHNRTGSRLIAGRKIFIPDSSAPAAVKKDTSIALAHQDKIPVKESRIEPEEKALPAQSAKTGLASSARFCWPIAGRITSGFGSRIDPFSRTRKFHNGIDISAEPGTPVKAAAAGSVIFSGWKDGYGNLVVVRHENGYISVYGHNSELKKKEGDSVEKGDIISLSGMTGAVTGAHVHFEIQKYQTPLNPLRLIK